MPRRSRENSFVATRSELYLLGERASDANVTVAISKEILKATKGDTTGCTASVVGLLCSVCRRCLHECSVQPAYFLAAPVRYYTVVNRGCCITW